MEYWNTLMYSKYTNPEKKSPVEPFGSFLAIFILLGSMYSGLPQYRSMIFSFTAVVVVLTYIYAALLVLEEKSLYLGLARFNLFGVCILTFAPAILTLTVLPFTGYLYILSFLFSLVAFTLFSFTFLVFIASISVYFDISESD